MIKVGDIVQFNGSRHGEVLLIGDGGLLVRVGLGKGHDGLVGWTEALGWQSDETSSCWFVSKKSATVVKSKSSFKGNIK